MNRYSKALIKYLKDTEYDYNVLMVNLASIIPEINCMGRKHIRKIFLEGDGFIPQYHQIIWLFFAFLAELSDDDLNALIQELPQ